LQAFTLEQTKGKRVFSRRKRADESLVNGYGGMKMNNLEGIRGWD
jgi:hypothetical protein